MKILPSPMFPVLAAAARTPATLSVRLSGTTTSTLIFGRKSTVYSPPRYSSVWPFWRPNPRTSETVIPITPMPVSASLTSSSLNGLMTASIFFMGPPRGGLNCTCHGEGARADHDGILDAAPIELAQEPDAVEVRHAQVEHDDVGLHALQGRQRVETVHGFEDLEVALEAHPVQRSPRGVIVHHEHPRHAQVLLAKGRCRIPAALALTRKRVFARGGSRFPRHGLDISP